MAIISILSAYIGVSFALMAPRNLESQARKLVSDLSLAREMSVAGHENIIVDFNLTSKNYFLYRNAVAEANLIDRKALEVDSITVNPAPENIEFYYPKGNTLENKQIVLNYKGKSKQITVFSDTGYVKWQ